MNLKKFHTVYFIGIGGIGMSSLAIYFSQMGKRVMGYDKTPSEVTVFLQNKGVQVFFEEDKRPFDRLSVETTLVVYTPAIPEDQSDFLFFKKQGFNLFKRSKILGIVTQEGDACFAVGGTHGKTTTSCILVHLLKTAGIDVTAFLGGFSSNYNSNFIRGDHRIFVVEADEYDRSFLALHPSVVCITSMDSDHLDVYKNFNNLETSFNKFSKKVNEDYRVIKKGLPFKGASFGVEDDSDFSAENVRILPEFGFEFDFRTPETTFTKVRFSGFGKHNLLNAIAAFAMVSISKIRVDQHKLLKGLSTFAGVKRRFSYEIRQDNIIYIDDYAHHPNEIRALHEAVRAIHPDKNITAVFQPHLYSRTQGFMDDFAVSLSKFDALILLDIYPARELPIINVTSKVLLEKVNIRKKVLCKKRNLLQTIIDYAPEVLLTIGAGDIGEQVPEITKALKYS